ncbi:MAG: stage IV sporulation protein A [Clostridia bacterium]|nr:stage IV sporulation protein A [Clostridia bacterium]
MNGNEIYENIAKRTDGQIYVGVVGPVRSGKSTFIKRFMETLVLPNIEDDAERRRARDELPQSSQGKTVMTTEPKFIPEKAVTVRVDGTSSFLLRMIDCVGFIVEGAEGLTEDGRPRMVHTPWSQEAMSFDEAAEFGTRKVISEHCTIAMLVTTDGTIGEIPRENYVAAEEKTAAELKKYGKPFVVILNCADTRDPQSNALAYELEEKYGAPVALVNCTQLDGDDIVRILEMILPQFPVTEFDIMLPDYLSALGYGHAVNKSIRETALKLCSRVDKIKDAAEALSHMTDDENIASVTIDNTDYGTGRVTLTAATDPGLYYASVSEISGCDIRDDADLFTAVKRMRQNELIYGKYAQALKQTEETGYGVAGPELSDMSIETPKVVKQTGGYGVKLTVSAHTTHMIGVDVVTEINPVVGTEQQSSDLVKYLSDEFDRAPENLWNTNMFGKTLKELADEGLSQKTDRLSEQTRHKFAETLQRVINEGSSGMICIIL